MAEGYAPLGNYQSWYGVVGNLDPAGPPGPAPLLILHGRPGGTHDYLLSLADLAEGGRPVIFYDQLGSGKSTHLPTKSRRSGRRPSSRPNWSPPSTTRASPTATTSSASPGEAFRLWSTRSPSRLGCSAWSSPTQRPPAAPLGRRLRGCAGGFPRPSGRPSPATRWPAPATAPSTPLPVRSSTSATCAGSGHGRPRSSAGPS